MNDREQQIADVCNKIKSLLLLKNKAYGDSALTPLRVFSKGDTVDGLLVRIDDKLSRIKNAGFRSASEDTLMDLIGYLVLLKVQIAEKDAAYSKAYSKVLGIDQLGLPKMESNGTVDLGKVRYTFDPASGY